MIGRPPTPTALKILGGTAQPCRVRADEPKPASLTHLPMPPPELNERAAQEWYTTAGELLNQRMLHAVDLTLLAAYCNEIAVYWECEDLLRKNGRVMKTTRKDGSTVLVQVPYVGIGRNALKMAHTLAGQFGFTPAARTRLSAPAGTDGDGNDPFAQMLLKMQSK